MNRFTNLDVFLVLSGFISADLEAKSGRSSQQVHIRGFPMLLCTVACNVVRNFALIFLPGSAIKVAILRYCVAVCESREHVVFVVRIDVRWVQMSLVKSLGTFSSTMVHFSGTLPEKLWNQRNTLYS